MQRSERSRTSPPFARNLFGARSWLGFTVLLVVAAAAAFYLPALRRTHGLWPAPLDDVYIHYGFARSAALGHPFAWIPGNGYSSGGTSLTYPLALAPGWTIGFRGANLGIFAALLACASIVDFARSLRRLLLPTSPRFIAWCAPVLLLAVPLLDWSWFSGMETAWLGAVLGRALVTARHAETASADLRPQAQLASGLWCAALVATRPETAPLAIFLALSVVHSARSLTTSASLARALGPIASFLALQAAANRALTGEWGAAGAIRKLLWSNPYATGLETATEVIKNLAALRTQALDAALGGAPFSSALFVLAFLAVLDRRARRLAIPLVLGAACALLLVSLNATARFQNLRYATPTLVMILAAAILGGGAFARRNKPFAVMTAALFLVAAIAPAHWFSKQIDLFARASQNIAEQQVEVARRLDALSPRPRRVFVGDAGAIPYMSGLAAIDGLGLGGFHDLPFARASVHGVPAVLELLERLPLADRPDVMAIYPSWWPGFADDFGKRIDSVKIEGNVICGADEKVLYAADWSALAPPDEKSEGAIDEIDVADLVSEKAHAYEFPTPHGGWAIGATLRDAFGVRRYDAGRIVPVGRAEVFTVTPDANRGPATLKLRTDDGDAIALRLDLERNGRAIATDPIEIPPRAPGAWFEVPVALSDLRGGDLVRIHAIRGAWRSFHVWVIRGESAALAPESER